MACLAIAFTINNASNDSIFRINDFPKLLYWLEDLSGRLHNVRESVGYINSLGLGNVVAMASDISSRIKQAYPVIWKKPKLYSEVQKFGQKIPNNVGIFCVVDNDFESCAFMPQGGIFNSIDRYLVCPGAIKKEKFVELSKMRGEDEGSAGKMWDSFVNIDSDPILFLKNKYEWFSKLCVEFDAEIKSLILNPSGIAIAHAYLSGQFNVKAPLSTWIK